MASRRAIFTTLSFILVAVFHAHGQYAQETFGKNRIQYRQFDWQYLSGENFDVYYYDNRKVIAQNALEFLESEFDRITDLIGYPPYFKTKVFLYNSLSELRQSNVGLNRTLYTVNGETEFIKPYVEVANLGTVQEFKEELLMRISELMVNEMMFGGSLKDIFQSSILMNLPDWFVDGASLYVAKGWSSEMDDYIRQIITKRKAKKITRLEGIEAALAGQSVWNFIAEKYGKSSVGNILNYTRITRNEEKSVLITLGVSFKQLMNEWHKYYSDMEARVSQSYVLPADNKYFTRHQNKSTAYTMIKISPDGENLAYAENDRGRYIVKVRSIRSGREKTIISGGSKIINDQRVDYRLPLISWADANTLGVVGIREGQYVFWLYDLQSRSRVPRELDKFSNIRSLNFSDNGRLVIVSADFEGRNDLFLLSTRKDRVRRLTNDTYDDLDPNFIPGSNRIVFSSNRTTDTLNAKAPVFGKLPENYNLFVYDLDTTKNVLKRITNTLSKDIQPIAFDDNNFYYLSDQRGIVNLFKYNRESGIYSQVTNYSTSVKDYDLNFNTNTLVFVASKRMKQQIFIENDFNVSRQVFTPATRRKELQQARTIREKRKQEDNKNMSIKDLLNQRLKESKTLDDSVAVDTVTTDTLQTQVSTSDTLKTDTVVNADTVKTDVVNTDNYQFEEPAPKKEAQVVSTDNYKFEDDAAKPQPGESFLTRYMKAREQSRITGPFPYETKFSADNLVTSMIIDPLRGLGILLEAQMNDMLENYRFNGGIMTTLDLRQGDVFAEFQYLPRFLDFSVRFDRKSVRWDPYPNESIYKYTLHKLEFGAAVPFSDRMRLTLKPFGAITYSVDLGEQPFPSGPPTSTPTHHYYTGVKSELVYDNSVTTGMNLMEGSRGKLSFTHYQGMDDGQNSFSRVSIDLRHYQQLYKEIVFAVRGFGGTFFGPSPKKFLLGGMNNWLFNKTYMDGVTSEGQENPLGVRAENQDVLFVEYATNLRGFDYGTLFGNSVMLMNAELRVPLVRALSNGPIASNFFRNLQFIGFYDIGTSWSGSPPFSSETSVSYDVVQNGPFTAKIKNYLNPWLYSYGLGVRTVVFSYYLKFDLAWPVENYEVKKPRGFLTLGFDF